MCGIGENFQLSKFQNEWPVHVKNTGFELSDLPKLKKFKCSDTKMDYFLIKESYYYHVIGEGITKLVVDMGSNEIAGYFTLKCDSMKVLDVEMSPEPKYIPCIELSRIAVANHWQHGANGIHLGTHLMGHIINLVKSKISTIVGCKVITLHSAIDKVKWYRDRFSFVEMVDEKTSDKDDTVYMCLDITDKSKADEFAKFVKANKK